jgi:hypothetical protein
MRAVSADIDLAMREGITCGNHPEAATEVKHLSVEAVRQCHLNPETFACTRLIERTNLIEAPEGETWEPYTSIVECGALAWPTDRGWECDAGHDHVDAQTRQQEGWDYAHDGQEAAQLRKQGVGAVAMNGGSI